MHSKRALLFFVVYILVTLQYVAFTCDAKTEETISFSEETKGIEFSVSLNKSRFELGETIIMTVTISNISQDKYYFIYKGLSIFDVLDIRVIDSNGKEVEYLGCLPAMPPPDVRQFKYIQPTEFFGKTINLISPRHIKDCGTHFDLSRPGNYTLKVSYKPGSKTECMIKRLGWKEIDRQVNRKNLSLQGLPKFFYQENFKGGKLTFTIIPEKNE